MVTLLEFRNELRALLEKHKFVLEIEKTSSKFGKDFIVISDAVRKVALY